MISKKIRDIILEKEKAGIYCPILCFFTHKVVVAKLADWQNFICFLGSIEN